MAARPFLGVVRRLRGLVHPVWTGVYARYDDVPVSGPGFDGTVWTAMTRSHTERHLAALGAGAPARPPGDRGLLPRLAAAVLAERGEVRIIDFGGGMGIGYIDVRGIVGAAAVEYVIVETPAVCAAGAALFAGDPAIRFVASLSGVGAGADIVHVNSALQYLPDPTETLQALARLDGRYLLLVNVSAGNVPTYVTAQRNVPGSVIAYWFLAVGELVDALRSTGYVERKRTKSERRLTGFAVPREYRLDRGLNLLFERIAPKD